MYTIFEDNKYSIKAVEMHTINIMLRYLEKKILTALGLRLNEETFVKPEIRKNENVISDALYRP